MTRLMALVALLAASPGLSQTVPTPDPVTAAEATRKVNIAGRQRMLSQRMAKAACLVSLGVEPAPHFDQLTQAYTLFQMADSALRTGNSDLGLGPEQDESVMAALARIDAPWASFDPLISDVIATGDLDTAAVETLSQASVEVLDTMNRAVYQTSRAYGDLLPDVPLALTITIDIAGRQRMLTQKAVKELCLMLAVADPAPHRDALAATIQLFDLSLDALQNGYEEVGVIAAPTPAIEDTLAEVRALWDPIKASLDQAAAGAPMSARDLAAIARDTEPLLRTMNAAVGLYEIE